MQGAAGILKKVIVSSGSGGVFSLACRSLLESDPRHGGQDMRMLMLVQFPPEPFNELVRKGTVGARMKKILEATKPETVYFTERDGKRGGIMAVEVATPSDVPRLAEPWFLVFNAEVEFRIAMTPEDLGKSNLEKLGKTWA